MQGHSLLVIQQRNAGQVSKGREGSLVAIQGQGVGAWFGPGGEANLQALIDEFPKRERSLSLATLRSSCVEGRVQRAARPGHGLVMSRARRSGDAEGFAGQGRCYRLMRIKIPNEPKAGGMQRGAAYAPLAKIARGPRAHLVSSLNDLFFYYPVSRLGKY